MPHDNKTSDSSSPGSTSPSTALPPPASAGRPQLPPPVKPARGVRQTIEALEMIEASGPQDAAKPADAAARFAGGLRDSARKPGEFRLAVEDVQDNVRMSTAWWRYAAAAVLALGTGWAAMTTFPALQQTFAGQSASRQPSQLELLQADVARLNGELSALQRKLAAPQAEDRLAAQARELAVLKKTLASLTAKMENERAAHARTVADLGARIERLAAADSKQFNAVNERLARLEKRGSDPQPVATINSTSVPRAGLPQLPPKPAAADRSRMPLNGYVLREVYRGVALIEGRNGFVEVHPGDVLPGAGMVRAIERRAGRWVVVTANGVIDTSPY